MTIKSNGLRTHNQNTLAAEAAARSFDGLNDGQNHHILMADIFEAAPILGISPRLASFMQFLAKQTSKQDWKQGSSPIVWMSNAHLADLHGVDERSISRWLSALHHLKFISFNDSANRKRRGARCPKTGDIVYAYGINLSPAIAFWEKAKQAIRERKAARIEMRLLRSDTSALRNKFRSLIVTLEAENALCDRLKRLYRVYSIVFQSGKRLKTLEMVREANLRAIRATAILRTICEKHYSDKDRDEQSCQAMSAQEIADYEAQLYAQEEQELKNMSGKPDSNVMHYTNTPTNSSTLFVSGLSKKSRAKSPSSNSHGLSKDETIPRAQKVYAADIETILPYHLKQVIKRGAYSQKVSWQSLERAVWTGLQRARVHEASWHYAIEQLGRETAISAAAMMLARDHITAPEAYLLGLVKKGISGNLNLVGSILKMKADRRVGRYQGEMAL